MIRRLWIVLSVLALISFSGMMLYYFMFYRPEQIALEYSHRLKIYFPDVMSLYTGASFRVKGVHFGKVEKLQIEEDRALVVLALREDTQIFENFSILLNPMNLFGSFYIELDPGDINRKVVLPTLYDQVLEGKPIGDPFNTFGALLNENKININEITQNLKEATEKIYNEAGTIGKILMDEKLYQYFLELVAEGRKLIADMRMYKDMDIHDSKRNEWTRSVIPTGKNSIK